MSESASLSPITVVGAGVMGSAIIRALLAAGYPVSVWNRTETRAQLLAQEGAALAPRVAEAIRASPITLMCISNQAAVRELLDDPEVQDALRSRTLVQLTTGTPRECRGGQAFASEHAINYLDGAIMAYPRTIGSDRAVILYAGDQDAFAANEALFKTLGTARFVGEDAGRPALIDAALIGLFYGTLAGFLHGTILARSAGLDLDSYLELALPFFRGFVSDAVDETGDRLRSRNYADPQSSMYTHLGGIDLLVIGASEEAGIEHEMMNAIKRMFERAIAAGRGDQDISSLVESALTDVPGHR